MIAYEYAAVGCGFIIRKTGRRSPIVEIQLSAQLGLVYSISKPAFFSSFPLPPSPIYLLKKSGCGLQKVQTLPLSGIRSPTAELIQFRRAVTSP